MPGTSNSVAYSGGSPGRYPNGSNIFDYVFGNPFQHEDECVPASQIIAPIDERQPIFIDNKTGKNSEIIDVLSCSEG